MNKIRLNNGKEYDVEFCGMSESVVNFRVADAMTVKAAAQKFSDADATAVITYLMPNSMVPDQPIVAAVYEGYTHLIGVLVNRWDGRALIQLEKGE